MIKGSRKTDNEDYFIDNFYNINSIKNKSEWK